MWTKKLLWRIYLSFFASTILAFIAMAWYVTSSFNQFYQEHVDNLLLSQARIIANDVAGYLPDTSAETIDKLCKNLGRLTQTRITIISPDGTVLGDSEEKPSSMENHKNRPEVMAAMNGKMGRSVRFSATKHQTLMYLALPIQRGGEVIAVARTSLPLSVIDWALHAVYKHILMGGTIIAVLFAVVALFILRRISRPIENMRRVAEKLAQGDLSARVPESDYEETKALARALNQMAGQLGERLRIITEQRGEQEAVFNSMVEGVLAVDKNECILHLNPAAARLLELDPETVRGRSIQEVIRNSALQKFIGDTLSKSEVIEGETVFYGKEDVFIQLHGTALKDASGANIGALVVFSDVTRLKRLETIRRDFVANVSHELKTPITALQGCVETLTRGASITNQERKKFDDMLIRHVNRLEAIVDDLLSLSQVEFDTEQGRIQLEPASISVLLERAVQNYLEPAQQKKIVLEVVCPENLMASINAALLEQAVGNLIDNALKYSGEGTHITIRGQLQDADIEISVADQGAGIEKKHLPRIFERFYRVDQARSRALGGTGLGLAIVKHIALAHRGTVGVTSAPGEGSTFTIRFPR
jgi:two-component system phosphate regulon sensor histidine kinase PhoR